MTTSLRKQKPSMVAIEDMRKRNVCDIDGGSGGAGGNYGGAGGPGIGGMVMKELI